jgi:hypothetical protein
MAYRKVGVKDNMKKNINKKIISISVIVVIIIAIAGLFYIKSKSGKPETSATNTISVTATVRKASFGSVVNVTLSEAGKKQYKGAVKYQVLYEGKPITSKEIIGKATTAFPERKQNDKVTIKLFKAEDKEAYSVDLKLQKEDVAK